jgi:hypothetical protein
LLSVFYWPETVVALETGTRKETAEQPGKCAPHFDTASRTATFPNEFGAACEEESSKSADIGAEFLDVCRISPIAHLATKSVSTSQVSFGRPESVFNSAGQAERG